MHAPRKHLDRQIVTQAEHHRGIPLGVSRPDSKTLLHLQQSAPVVEIRPLLLTRAPQREVDNNHRRTVARHAKHAGLESSGGASVAWNPIQAEFTKNSYIGMHRFWSVNGGALLNGPSACSYPVCQQTILIKDIHVYIFPPSKDGRVKCERQL
jgi:hypothetical protein